MEPIVTTVLTGVFSVLVAVITSTWFSKRMMKDDRIEELAKDIKVIKDKQDNIEKKLDENRKNDEMLSEASIGLLKDRFEHLSNKALEEGAISMADLNAITRLSVSYFKLDDADGTGHNLLERVKQLPLKKNEKQNA